MLIHRDRGSELSIPAYVVQFMLRIKKCSSFSKFMWHL